MQYERLFSALRRIKSYLRTTMSQERMNQHVHKHLTNQVILKSVMNFQKVLYIISGFSHRETSDNISLVKPTLET